MKIAPPLTPWQKKQSLLLYHFSSMNYLKEISVKVNELTGFSNGALDLAKSENRDQFLSDKRWGERNTSQNWSNNAWQFLADFQKTTATNVANRSYEIYSRTGMNQCARGLSEFSTLWLTPDEESTLDNKLAELSTICRFLDDTADKTTNESSWDDFMFAVAWKEFQSKFIKGAKLRLCPDIIGESGKKPPRTGVYLPLDDSYGAAQFAWTGGSAGKLLECQTFNELGIAAIEQVGRDGLWLDDQAMFKFATQSKHHGRFDDKMECGGILHPNLAPSAIAREAFVAVPRKWVFVEQIEGEFEDIDNTPTPHVWRQTTRVEGGDTCRIAGYYFTPVNISSRRFFNAGELMPDLGSPIGKTIWQWDEAQ